MASNDTDIRRIRKKLAQIVALEGRCGEGDVEFSAEEKAKIGLKDQFESDLQRLLDLQAEALAAPKQPPTAALSVELPGRDRPPALDDDAPATGGRKGKKSSGALDQARITPKCRSPTWQEDPAGVEDVAPTPKAAKEPDFELIEAVQPFAPATRESERLGTLLRATRELSMDAFDEDALEMCTKKGRWKLTLLAAPKSPDVSGSDPFGMQESPGSSSLIGFIVWRLTIEHQGFAIAKLAIVPEHRRRGHGCRLIDWCVRYAKKQPNIQCISLSSLPEAVCFYKALGFKQHDVRIDPSKAGVGENEELIEGQVYMEYRIRGFRRKSKK